MRGPRAGAILLEVLIAVTLLGLGGSAVGLLLSSYMMDAHRRLATEGQENAAGQVLALHALLGRRELEQRIGSQAAGPFVVRVTRPTPDIFRIAVSDVERAEGELVVTLLYRPRERP